MEIEWDESKLRSNLDKHGVDFADAVQVFADRHAIVVPDARRDYGEPRVRAIGSVAGVGLAMVFTDRGDRRRITSARRASRRERQAYETFRA